MRLLFAALALIVGTTPAAAQWLDRPWSGIPRTADGKPNLAAPAPRGPGGKPDLTGIWSGPVPEIRVRPRQRAAVGQRSHPSASARVPQGASPRITACRAGLKPTDPPGGSASSRRQPRIAILNEDLSYRVIHMDGRELEANPAPSWMGYSVGRWEGDTLVVESDGFNEKTWLSRYGQSHTEALRVRERVPAPRLRPPRRRSDLHRSASLHEALGLHGGDGTQRRYGDARVDLRTFQRPMAGRSGCRRHGGDRRARGAGAVRRRLPWRVRRRQTRHRSDAFRRSVDCQSHRPRRGRRRRDAAVDPAIPDDRSTGWASCYQFVVGDNGVATALDEIHISGPERFPKQPR